MQTVAINQIQGSQDPLDYVLAHLREMSIVGHVEAADTQALLDVCATGYRPHQIVALGEPGVEPVTVLIFEGRGLIDGQATAYVCIDFVCQRPVTEGGAFLPTEPRT